MTAPPPPLRVEMAGVRKRFGSVRALRDADLRLRPGEVHAVLGENGAGKSTLLRILAGHLQPDAGRIDVDGRAVQPRSPREAWTLGIGMVHQHFTLVPRLTVLENLVLGTRSGAAGFRLPLGPTRDAVEALRERTGLAVRLDAAVEDLGVGSRQRVEILKILLREPRVLVLDEPTAVLAPSEVDGLLELLRGLAGEGRAVVLVAHKLDEVLAVADRVTVLRGGRTLLTAPRAELTAVELARAMVGREVETVGREGATTEGIAVPPTAGPPVARLRDVTVGGGSGDVLRSVDLEVGAGEIVGVAGVEGNGQRVLARLVAGRRRPDAGTVELPPDPAFIPGDRTLEGLIPDFDLAENVALALHRRPAFRSGPFLHWGRIRERTREGMERFEIRAPGTRGPAASLSGGNQQRLVVARELDGAPTLLVAENPTRGLDVAAEAFVHRALLELRGAEHAPGILLVSTDLDEVLALADRIFVMVRGRLLPVPPDRRNREAVGELMLGGGPASPVEP